MEGDYLELSQFPYNPHPFPYNSHQSPLGTTGFLTNGIRAVDPETSNFDERKLLKKIQGLLNKALEESKDISKKMKALDESNMAMKEELSRVQENLENMSEEEFQLLEGTSEKFQVVESTKTVLDSEDVADLEEFLDLKELVLEEHNAFPCPVQSPRILCNQPYLVLDSLSVHSLDIVYPEVSKFYNELHASLASCGVNGFKVDLGLGNGDKVSLFLGCHQAGVTFPSMFENSALTWRFLGDKPKLMFLEGLLATLMEANMYPETFTPTNGGDNCGINDGFHSPADHNFYKKLCLKSRALHTYCLDDEEWNVKLLATTLSDLHFQERITSCKKQYEMSFPSEPREIYQCVLEVNYFSQSMM